MVFKVTVSISFLQRIGNHHREMFSNPTSTSSHQSCYVKKVFLKFLQYSQENTCVVESRNKVAGLKPPTQLFFCEYCTILKATFFYRPPFRCVTKGGGEDGGLPCPFLNIKKVPRFWKKGPDSVLLSVKFSIQNIVLRVSRRNGSVMKALNVLSSLILHSICQ